MQRVIWVGIVVLALACTQASGQTSTGRHRVERDETEEREEELAPQDARYFVAAGAGLATSGDLLRIRTAGTSGIRWDPGGTEPFASENVLLTLDEDIALAAAFGGRLLPALWYRLDASAAVINLAAEARIGEGAETRLWDTLSLVHASLALEYRLVSLASFPYVFAGAGVMSVSADRDEQFDQTQLAWRLGGGYQLTLHPQWALRAEVRDAVAGLEVEDYVPPVIGNQLPDYEIEDKGPTHAFEMVLMLTGAF
ncbi:hypothetical protein GF314_08060 [bacterium]|nr:hypothetical protein [bacterium]